MLRTLCFINSTRCTKYAMCKFRQNPPRTNEFCWVCKSMQLQRVHISTVQTYKINSVWVYSIATYIYAYICISFCTLTVLKNDSTNCFVFYFGSRQFWEKYDWFARANCDLMEWWKTAAIVASGKNNVLCVWHRTQVQVRHRRSVSLSKEILKRFSCWNLNLFWRNG